MLARFPGMFQEHPKSSNWMRRTFGKLKPRAMTGYREADNGTVEHWNCDHPDISEVVLWDLTETPIDMARNRCIVEAQEMGCDYVLMIDADMAPDEMRPGWQPFWESSWEWIRRQRVPTVIAAPYVGPGLHQNIYVFRWANWVNPEHDPGTTYALRQYTREEAAERAGFEQVAALPTGLILYDLKIFERAAPPYFYYDFDKKFTKKESTEDVTNTRDLSFLWHDVPGAGCWVNWNSWARHVKLTEFGGPQLTTTAAIGDALRRAWTRGMGPGERVMEVRRDVDLGASVDRTEALAAQRLVWKKHQDLVFNEMGKNPGDRLVVMDSDQAVAAVRKACPDLVPGREEME